MIDIPETLTQYIGNVMVKAVDVMDLDKRSWQLYPLNSTIMLY